MPLALIVAMGRGRAIGKAGHLPWHKPADLVRFKALTLGHSVIMGRKTYESIGRALPGRRNIVLTRDETLHFPDCVMVSSLARALCLVEDDEMPFVIGGASVYALALPVASHLFLTEIPMDVPGADAFFPMISLNGWEQVRRHEEDEMMFTDFERVLDGSQRGVHAVRIPSSPRRLPL